MKQHCCMALAALILTTTPLLAAGPGPHWDYTGHEGTAHCGDIDKGYAECKLGIDNGHTVQAGREPIEASAKQIKKFSAIFGVNARPVQPLNTRVVRESL